MLMLLGARIDLTPAAKGMTGAVNRARELVAEIPARYCCSNSRTRPIRKFTARRRRRKSRDTGGGVDAVISEPARRHPHRRRRGR